MQIIENALIGGNNGQMAFIYNNHFIRELFDQFEFDYDGSEYKVNRNYESAKFKAFLNEIIKEEKDV